MGLPTNVRYNKSMINRKTGYGGLCLAWVRQCFLYKGKVVPAVHPTAIAAYRATKKKHTGRKPPYGVPVWFGPSPWVSAGHVAFSLGDGTVLTTNSSTNKIHRVSINLIEKQWKQEYLGWSEDINGVRIYVPDKKTYNGRLDRPTILKLQRALKTPQDGIISDRVLVTNNVLHTRGNSLVIRALQRKFKTKVDGHISYPKSSLVLAMQKKYKLKHKDGQITATGSDLIREVQRRLDLDQF